MAVEGFWADEQNATAVVRQLKSLKSVVEPWESLQKKYEELQGLLDIAGAGDTELLLDLRKNGELVASQLASLSFRSIFSGEFDPNNAILSINAGAGGTESCDWVSMLCRMYSRWAEGGRGDKKRYPPD
jgi:peptide chain release factor 2